ncbi:cytochrome P450 [Lipomyces kononenkoae]|uniref:Cytochrome P450 n=1 Tax=Lipomyces kononenkoae TaxID=34357 RepID=A0ACC3SZN4_LIPKO
MPSTAFITLLWITFLVAINKYIYQIPGLLFYGLVLLGICCRSLYNWQIHPFYFSTLRGLPQPRAKPHWLWGHFVHAVDDGQYLLDWCEENPDADLMRMLGMMNSERILPVSPRAMMEILQTQAYTFIKPPFMRRSLNGILGNGVLFAEGEDHKHQRKVLMPAFAYSHIKSLAPVFMEESARLVKLLREKVRASEKVDSDQVPEIDVARLLSLLTLDILYRAGLGITFNALENPDNELGIAYDRVFSPTGRTSRIFFLLQSLIPGFRFIPISRNLKLWRARQTINKFAYDAILAKMANHELSAGTKKAPGEKDVDILSVMIDEGNGQWTVQSMMDQLLTFLVAGHETTASAVTLALYHLSLNQAVQDKLRDEIHAKFPAGYDSIKTYEDIESLTYLNNVVRELLRVQPPVIGTIRMAKEDTYVTRQFIPKGTLVNIPIVSLNKSRQLWGEDAREFNPDRWDGRQANNVMAFLTFLQGPRSCIGRRFAEIEFKSILLSLIGNFKFALKEGRTVEFRTSITYRPLGGLPLVVTPVSGW